MSRKSRNAIKPTDTFYHYCSAATLHAVLDNRTLRLTSIASMNDAMEMKWGMTLLRNRKDFQELVALAFPSLTMEQFMGHMEAFTLVLATCFSTESDALSQWRAYADNGAGYCIGFRASALQKLQGRLLKVQYTQSDQGSLVDAKISRFLELAKDASDGEKNRLAFELVNFMIEVAALKNPAFAEEKEVRLINFISTEERNGALMPIYPGSMSDSLQLKFVMRGSVPTPYIDLDFSELKGAIKEIWVGPTAVVEDRAIRLMLGAMGYDGVSIHRSTASYRKL